MRPARVTSELAVDWTKCFDYERLVAEEIAHYSQLEVTAELKEGGVHANRAWLGWYQFLCASWKTDFGAEIVGAARRFEAPRLLSLGCGYGGMELDCARRLVGPYEMLALDVNESLFRRARVEVASAGLHVEFQALDLNFLELEPSSLDVVFAHASLHHLLNFEHLFAQVHRALKENGRLIVLDIIGKTQVLFWPENIRFATELVARMPERYRQGLAAEPQALFAGYLDGSEQSGMEGIRQEELEDQLSHWFHPLQMFKYNSFVRLICTHPTIAPAFDPDRPEDRAYLDSLYRLDLDQIARGNLRPTEMFAVYERRPATELAPSTTLRREPKVSVWVDCDGSAAELVTCFSSLRAQTHGNLEILLFMPADDGDVVQLAHRLASSRADVRLIASPSRADGFSGWRDALTVSRSDYVACMSSRDTWYPVKVAEQVALLEERPALGLAYSQAVVVDERGRRSSQAFGTDRVGEEAAPAALEGWLDGDPAPRSTLLIRRACLEQLADLDADLRTEEDFALHVVATREAGFLGHPLGMLRAPAGDLATVTATSRVRKLRALQTLRLDLPRLVRRGAATQLRAALDRRVAELTRAIDPAATGSRAPRRPLDRLRRWLAGRA